MAQETERPFFTIFIMSLTVFGTLNVHEKSPIFFSRPLLIIFLQPVQTGLSCSWLLFSSLGNYSSFSFLSPPPHFSMKVKGKRMKRELFLLLPLSQTILLLLGTFLILHLKKFHPVLSILASYSARTSLLPLSILHYC